MAIENRTDYVTAVLSQKVRMGGLNVITGIQAVKKQKKGSAKRRHKAKK